MGALGHELPGHGLDARSDPDEDHHGHGHAVDHEHDGHQHTEHEHDGHGHEHRSGAWPTRLRHSVLHAVRPHSHDSADRVDSALEGSRQGTRAVWISFVILLATAVVQGVVVLLSGSVALLGDTLHNVADALTAVPLAIAFAVGRRPPTRRFTYGLGRAEDLAGLVVLLLILLSSIAAGWEAVRRLLDPQDVDHLWLVATAAVIGFIGNEAVARYRMRVGRQIGSAALVADGLHARTDSLTSLSVIIAAIGSALGWRWADPVVGLLITLMIMRVLLDAAKQVFSRILDGVDPELVDQLNQALAATPTVQQVGRVRVRWVGHALHADVEIGADPTLDLVQAHALAHEAEHRLLHAVPRLAGAVVHVQPVGAAVGAAHQVTLTHTN